MAATLNPEPESKHCLSRCLPPDEVQQLLKLRFFDRRRVESPWDRSKDCSHVSFAQLHRSIQLDIFSLTYESTGHLFTRLR